MTVSWMFCRPGQAPDPASSRRRRREEAAGNAERESRNGKREAGRPRRHQPQQAAATESELSVQPSAPPNCSRLMSSPDRVPVPRTRCFYLNKFIKHPPAEHKPANKAPYFTHFGFRCGQIFLNSFSTIFPTDSGFLLSTVKNTQKRNSPQIALQILPSIINPHQSIRVGNSWRSSLNLSHSLHHLRHRLLASAKC